MPKFVVRGADKPEEIVEFWLERSGDGRSVLLCAQFGDVERTILAIRGDGLLHRHLHSPALYFPGLQYDDRGRIKEVE